MCEEKRRKMSDFDRKRTDIFRVMDKEICKTSKRDIRSREFINPQRIIWTNGNVKNADALLRAKDQQSSLIADDVCGMSNDGSEKASVLLDFGVEIHGGIRIVGAGEKSGKGTKVRVRFGESVSEAMSEIGGEYNATNDHARRDMIVEIGLMSMNQIGETGFRFVRIDLEEPDAALSLKAICAVLVFKDVPYRGSFECSDPLLNRIWDVGAYTVHLNMQEYIWDGIKRDRLVWVGDMHPETTAIYAVFGDDDSVEKSLDFTREQTPLPNWVNGFSTYSMWYAMIVADYYKHFGKREFVEKQRDYLCGLFDLFSAQINEDGKNIMQMGETARFIDWPSVGREKVIDAGVQAMHIMMARSMKDIFVVLGDEKRAKQCDKDIERLQQVALDYEDSKQAAAMMVMAGLADPVKTNEELLSVGGAKGMSTFMGYYILTARAMAGDYVGALNAAREYWGGMLSLGATTFWEDFDIEWLENAGRIDEMPEEGKVDVHAKYGRFCYQGYRHSFCHGWAAGVTPWLSENVLGIKILEPGCKKVKITPHLGDLSWAKGSYPTPYGEIKISHEKMQDGSIHTEVNAPEGVEVVLN